MTLQSERLDKPVIPLKLKSNAAVSFTPQPQPLVLTDERTTNTQQDVEERGFKCRLTIIDTVGFGDFVINSGCWEPIVNYIDDQHARYMEAESQAVRNLNAIDDTRVHACLYFIQPSGHGLSVLDVQAMKELSTRVNLVPIIAKADSMIPLEVPLFKKRVMESLRFHEIPTFTCPVMEDDDVDTRNLAMEINVRTRFYSQEGLTLLRLQCRSVSLDRKRMS